MIPVPLVGPRRHEQHPLRLGSHPSDVTRADAFSNTLWVQAATDWAEPRLTRRFPSFPTQTDFQLQPGLARRLSVLAGHDQARFVGDDDRLGAVTQAELVQHPADMGLHRLFGDQEPVCDLGIRETLRDEA